MLDRCCRAHMEAIAVMVVSRGCLMVIGFGFLQRTAAAGVAWQRSVRRRTASEDCTCGNGIVGRLGLQRTAAGCSAWLGYPVRYMSEDGASDFSGLLTRRRRLCARVKQQGEVDLRRRFG
ncbi:hypothetical protein SETIT_3G350500v2 [Setaria italica]|uniref:Uncharacterized protein n=1 Tax=Setaria italica TaxID=4555 RepID=A0A368QM22_SETIT|nr:hypothetical protein SETIT_3G350500v2 [Setaria italica]